MLHVVMSTDSLSLPRPWSQKIPSARPELFTHVRQTYPLLLETLLRGRYPSSEVRVTNLATRASSLGASISHRLELFAWMEADVAVLHKGVVDCWPRPARGGEPNTSPVQFQEALDRLLAERARMAPTLPFIIIGIAPTNDAANGKEPRIGQNITAYNAILRNRIDDRMRFIDMEQAMMHSADGTLHPDGHHLTAAGHAILTEHLGGAITDLLGPGWQDRDAA